jgi:hypothetical protein
MGDAASRSFIPYLIFTAIVCGALVMVVEVLGSRCSALFQGKSLRLDISITVTLVRLPSGYAAEAFSLTIKQS